MHIVCHILLPDITHSIHHFTFLHANIALLPQLDIRNAIFNWHNELWFFLEDFFLSFSKKCLVYVCLSLIYLDSDSCPQGLQQEVWKAVLRLV